MKTKISALFVTAILTGLSASAEPRVWTDTSGKSIEAEFVILSGRKAVLKQADGTTLKVSLEKLSAADRDYVVLNSPPPIDIDVNMDVDRSNDGNGRRIQIQTETISAEVTITKPRAAHYEAPLFSQVYIIGQREQEKSYVIMERAESEFTFTGENKDGHTYSSASISQSQLEGGIEAGTEFKGYLAVVFDQNGNLLEAKSNKPEFEKAAEAILASRKGDKLDRNFAVTGTTSAKESGGVRPRRWL